MKKVLILAVLSFYSAAVLSGETLNGNYICKRGFLGFSRVDSLSVNSLHNGGLQIDMDDRNFTITKNCKLTNVDNVQVKCDKETNKISLSKTTKDYMTTVTSTLSFEKIKGIVIVREGEKSAHSTREAILICRSVN